MKHTFAICILLAATLVPSPVPAASGSAGEQDPVARVDYFADTDYYPTSSTDSSPKQPMTNLITRLIWALWPAN